MDGVICNGIEGYEVGNDLTTGDVWGCRKVKSGNRQMQWRLLTLMGFWDRQILIIPNQTPQTRAEGALSKLKGMLHYEECGA